jgi:hypothetical protein
MIFNSLPAQPSLPTTPIATLSRAVVTHVDTNPRNESELRRIIDDAISNKLILSIKYWVGAKLSIMEL